MVFLSAMMIFFLVHLVLDSLHLSPEIMGLVAHSGPLKILRRLPHMLHSSFLLFMMVSALAIVIFMVSITMLSTFVMAIAVITIPMFSMITISVPFFR